jgi:PAS domain S-box-containing protein
MPITAEQVKYCMTNKIFLNRRWRRMMLFWRWLYDIPLVDPVERKLAPLLQLALIAILAALAVALVIALVQIGLAAIPPVGLLAALFFVLVCLGTIVLVRRGSFKAAAWILLILLYVTAARRLLIAGPETADESAITLFLPITIAGVFLGRRVLVSLVALSCILVILPDNAQKLGSSTVTVFVLNLLLVAFLLDQLANTLRHELKEALVHNQELERTHQALEIFASDLFKANERLTVTLKSIGDAVITTDATGRIMLLNDVAQRLTGWTQAEAEGQPLMSVFRIVNEYTRQPVENPADKVIREGVVVGLANHTMLISKDGREIPIDDSGAPIVDNSGKISGVVLVFRDIIERRKTEERERELATLNERQRLARELHDSVSQALFSANVIAEAVPRIWESSPERALMQLRQVRELTQGATAEMRTLLLELRPENIVKTALGELLTQLAHTVQARRKINISVRIRGDEAQSLPEDVHFALYRIAQESLNNIVRHSSAKESRVRLIRSQQEVELVIVDNGQGFDTKGNSSGFGLVSILERAEAIQAVVLIQSKAGIGTRVKVVRRLGEEQQ